MNAKKGWEISIEPVRTCHITVETVNRYRIDNLQKTSGTFSSYIEFNKLHRLQLIQWFG